MSTLALRAQIADVGPLGREPELAAIDKVLGRDSGEGLVLLLRGSAGVGKSALLRAAHHHAEARGYRVLRTSGSEAETPFAFAGLQPLLLPVIDQDAGLSPHLRTALRSALGLVDEAIPALETVALAAVGVLTALASEIRPLCLIVDDAHWLDAATIGVVRFLARRLGADPLVLLAAAREGDAMPAGDLPEIQVEPLTPAAAEALLSLSAPGLSASARRRVLAEAEGNPLALVELSRALGAALRDQTRVLPQILPLTKRLEAAFTRRMDQLPEESQALLLAAALAPTANLADLLAAASAIVGRPVELPALDQALLSELADIDGRNVHFRHPLVRSGLISATPLTRRRAAHEALAGVMTDVERRLHHRAEAQVGYDDGLAAELEEAAGLALRRGSRAAAVSALQQAAALTIPGPMHAGRLVRAAAMCFELGRSDEARLFLLRADGVKLDLRDEALARLVTAAVGEPDSDDTAPVWDLIELAQRAIEAGDHDGALRLLEFASTRIIWGEPGRAIGRAVVATAKRVPDAETDPRVTAMLASATPIEGHRELATRLALVDEEHLTDAEAQRLIGSAAVIAGDYEQGNRLLDRAERQLRRQAQLALLASVLTFRGVAIVNLGQWRLAREVLDEAERLAAETNQPAWLNRARQVRAGLAGMSGDHQLHREIVDEQTLTYQRMRGPHRQTHLRVMQGKTAAMLGHMDDALTLLGGLFDPADRYYDARSACEAFFYLADAASAKNRADVVHRAIEVMNGTVPAPWPPVLQSGIDYARAVIAEDPQVKQQLFEAALIGAASSRPFDHARIQLAYGSWLRRVYRRLEARERLREARGTFERLGNEPYAQRARDELRATGEASPPRHTAAWDALSAHELHIARLAADGLSNKEIGERLFLSHRTVSSHLYRIFPKLGITSRAQLAALFRSP